MMMMIMSVEWRGGCGGNSLTSPTVLAAETAAGEIELLHSMLMSFWNC